MSKISRESFEEYRDLLDRAVERSIRDFRKRMRKAADGFMGAPDETARSVYRQAIVDEVYGRIDTGRAEIQMRADDFFEQVTGADATAHDPYPYEKAEARVRSAAVHLFQEGSAVRFLEVLEEFIGWEVRAGAQEAIAEDVEAANRLRARP